MGTGIGGASGGGIHPGAPIIWPTSKKTASQSSTSSPQTTQSSASAASSAASAASAASSASAAAQAKPTAPAAPATPAARPMAMADVVEQLFQLGIPNSSENKELASMMMQHGLELSGDNFSQLFKMLKGDKQNSTLESAVITLSKGLGASSKSVDVLSGFLSSNPQIAQQMQSVRQALMELQQKMSLGQNVLDPGLLNSLTSLLSNVDEELKKFLKREADDTSQVGRGEMLNDMKGLSQLLGGIEQKLAESGKLNTPEGRELQRQLNALKEQLKGPIDNLTSQVILSKDADRNMTSVNDKFAYYQIPNPFGEKMTNAEIAIRKDPSKKKGDFDPQKTRLVIKVDTPDLGEIAIIVDVLDQKVWYIFNTEHEDVNHLIQKTQGDLLKRMESLNLRVSGFQAVKKKIDIRKFILPTINLDSIVRIRTEV